MKKVTGYVSIGQTKEEFEFEITGEETDEELEAMAKEEIFGYITWGWWTDDDGEPDTEIML